MSKLDALLSKLQERIAAAPDLPISKRPRDAAVCDSERFLDPVNRESHVRMILHLRDRYRLHFLVAQGLFGKNGFGDLSDDEVIALHRDLDRAVQCIQDGISFEDAGLIRSLSTE